MRSRMVHLPTCEAMRRRASAPLYERRLRVGLRSALGYECGGKGRGGVGYFVRQLWPSVAPSCYSVSGIASNIAGRTAQHKQSLATR